jgi:flagellar motility protein MotE (MotC chaperone)
MMMMRRPDWLRLLPIMIFVMSSLLVVKSAQLVRAAVTPHEAAANVVSTAEAATPAEHPPGPQATAPTLPAAAPTLPDETAPPLVTDTERALLQELRQRREELDARDAALAARESVLAAAGQKLSARVAELQGLQKKLESLDAARREREDTSWKGLVKVYEAMKPRDAATIFNDLETPVLLQVVDRMKEAKAAPVLAAMQTDKARDLTAKLAQMRTQRDSRAGS